MNHTHRPIYEIGIVIRNQSVFYQLGQWHCVKSSQSLSNYSVRNMQEITILYRGLFISPSVIQSVVLEILSFL